GGGGGCGGGGEGGGGGGDGGGRAGLRAARQGAGAARLRAARLADDGAGLRRRLARCRPQPLRRVRGGLLGEGGPPARLGGVSASGGRDGGPGGVARLAHPVQVPARRLRRPVRRERRAAAPRDRLGRDRRRVADAGAACRDGEEALQPARRLDRRGGHAAETVPVGGLAVRRGR